MSQWPLEPQSTMSPLLKLFPVSYTSLSCTSFYDSVCLKQRPNYILCPFASLAFKQSNGMHTWFSKYVLKSLPSMKHAMHPTPSHSPGTIQSYKLWGGEI